MKKTLLLGLALAALCSAAASMPPDEAPAVSREVPAAREVVAPVRLEGMLLRASMPPVLVDHGAGLPWPPGRMRRYPLT